MPLVYIVEDDANISKSLYLINFRCFCCYKDYREFSCPRTAAQFSKYYKPILIRQHNIKKYQIRRPMGD